MATLRIEKLLFFIAPVIFVILAVGIFNIPNKFFIRTICLTMVISLFLINSSALCYKKPALDGTREIKMIRDKIEQYQDINQEQLCLISVKAPRIIFSLGHALSEPLHMSIVNKDHIEHGFQEIKDLEKYERVFFINYYLPYLKRSLLYENEIKYLVQYLKRHNFDQIKSEKFGWNISLLVFEKKIQYER